MSPFNKILAGIGVVFVAFTALVGALTWWYSVPRGGTQVEPVVTQAPKLDRKEQVQAAVNRGERQLIATIKANMHDPDSFDLVSDNAIDAGDHIAMVMVYRGRNGFNALRKSAVGARIELNGEITWMGPIE